MISTRTLLLTLTALIVAVPAAEAQNAPANGLYVITATVRPERAAAYEDYIREVQAAAARVQATPNAVLVFQNVLGGPMNRYRFVIPMDDMADMDSWKTVPEIMIEAHGERNARQMMEAGSGAVLTMDNAIRALQPNYSSSSAEALGTLYAEVITTEVDPTMTADYNDFLHSLKVAEENHGVRRDRRANAMGTLGTYTSVISFDTFEQRSKVPGALALLQAEYGEQAGQRIMDRGQAAVRGRTIEVIRLREDLSRMPTS